MVKRRVELYWIATGTCEECLLPIVLMREPGRHWIHGSGDLSHQPRRRRSKPAEAIDPLKLSWDKPAKDAKRCVYVIELRDVEKPRTTPRPCVYVGQSLYPVEIRFAQHKQGHRASKYVKRFGKHPLRELSRDIECTRNYELASREKRNSRPASAPRATAFTADIDQRHADPQACMAG